MKKTFLFAALAAVMLCACNPDNVPKPTPPNPDIPTPDPIGTTYPRVQVIEHFTGQGCGYCPMGMDQIFEVYSTNPESFVWISNHTYGTDNYTIRDSKTVAKKLGVSGAPLISINRVKHDGSYNYHPAYTEQYMKKESKTATSQISLARTYDASTRELTVTVLGKTAEEDIDSVLVTLAVTESGEVGEQSDYLYSWNGWKRFTHTHTVRTYLSAAMGDNVKMTNRAFEKKYTTTLSDAWAAENCEIVAWITKNNEWNPILNAAKLPVVEGTQGGEDIKHGGIEENPVPDYYPEQGRPVSSFSLKTAYVTYYPQSGYTLAHVIALNQDTTVGTYSGYPCFPYVSLYIYLPGEVSAIPAHTYEIKEQSTDAQGHVVPGYRDDEKHEVDGSQLMYTFYYDNELYLATQWMLASGSVTVSESGFSIDATTKNGSTFHAEFVGTIETSSGAAGRRIAPKRFAGEESTEEL